MLITLFNNANFATALVTHSGKWSCFLLHGYAGWMTGRGHCPLWNVLRLSRGIFLQAFRKLLLPNILPSFGTFTGNRTLYAVLHMLCTMHTVHSWWATITQISKLAHRVDRVLGLLSSSELGLAGECMCSPFLLFGGGGEGTLACGRGGGGSQFRGGDRHCGILGIYVFCEKEYLLTVC